MKFFVNLTSLRFAGGKRVALGMLEGFRKMEKKGQLQHTLIVLVPEGREYVFDSEKIIFEILPKKFSKAYNFLRKEKWFKQKVNQYSPDVIFELGNIAMAMSHIPQLLLIQWPYVAYPESIVWNSMSFFSKITRKIKMWLIQKRLHYATSITVQTLVMKDRLEKNLRWEGPIHIVQSAIDEPKGESSKMHIDNRSSWLKKINSHASDGLKILYLTRYYSHKNIEVLLEAAEYAKKNTINILFLTTIAPHQDGAVQNFIDNISHRNLESHILNLSEIPQDEVYILMDKVDALVMPTLLETYGLPYYEAMKSGLPIFTSDMDFARDACGDIGFFFDPLDGKDITEKIYKAFENANIITKKIKKGKRKVEKIPSWEEVATYYIHLLEDMNNN